MTWVQPQQLSEHELCNLPGPQRNMENHFTRAVLFVFVGCMKGSRLCFVNHKLLGGGFEYYFLPCKNDQNLNNMFQTSFKAPFEQLDKSKLVGAIGRSQISLRLFGLSSCTDEAGISSNASWLQKIHREDNRRAYCSHFMPFFYLLQEMPFFVNKDFIHLQTIFANSRCHS